MKYILWRKYWLFGEKKYKFFIVKVFLILEI